MGLFGDGKVLTCKVTECSYNDAEVCRAKDIEVGSAHAQCDTFTTGGAPERESDMAEVGRCDVTVCSFNKRNDCNAPGITVEWHERHADCVTFRLGGSQSM
jgi:hypothetical protein